LQSFDLAALKTRRAGWGIFRDRRPDHYRILSTSDGIIE
jgi:N-carbamoylputrescine amidase